MAKKNMQTKTAKEITKLVARAHELADMAAVEKDSLRGCELEAAALLAVDTAEALGHVWRDA